MSSMKSKQTVRVAAALVAGVLVAPALSIGAAGGAQASPAPGNADQQTPTQSIQQFQIPYTENWPASPSPYNMRDWTKTADNFYDLAFNPKAHGPELPINELFTVDTKTPGGFSGPTFSMPSYLNAWNNSGYATNYQVEASRDGTHWKTVQQTDAGQGAPTTVTLGNQRARYLRLDLNAAHDEQYTVTELRVYGTGNSHTDLAVGKTVTASSTAELYPAAHATDGDLNTAWQSSAAGAQTLTLDLGTSRQLGSMQILWSSPFGEGVDSLASVLGATLMGRDMTKYAHTDWVKMIESYYNKAGTRGFVSNNPGKDDTTGSFWYDLYPTALFTQIATLYPHDASLRSKTISVANSWLDALGVLSDNWNHTGFSMKTMTTSDSGDWIEPDGAIGVAYLEYLTYTMTGQQKYLAAAQKVMSQVSGLDKNPLYEILGSYGPYLAARMNAEQGTGYPLNKFLDNVFTAGSDSRPGWGTVDGRWGDYDTSGLMGDTGGYAFAMNTFVSAGMIAPVARYAPQYSTAIGKYLLNAANNANLFFPDTLPANMQQNPQWYQQTGIRDIAYEGLKNQSVTQPYATGDNADYYGVYSTAPVGMLAAMTSQTNVPKILRFDLTKTDFGAQESYPTSLYYNPYADAKNVDVPVGNRPSDLYDAASGRFVARNVTGTASVRVAGGTSAQIVIVPAHATLTQKGNALQLRGVTVSYDAPAVQIIGVRSGATVKGTVALGISVNSPADDPIADLTVKFGSTILYSGADVPTSLNLDSTRFANGSYPLTATVTTKSGRHGASSTTVITQNMLGGIAYTADAAAIAAWQPTDTTLTTDGATATMTVTGNNTWGFALSPSIALDLDRQPILTVDEQKSSLLWGVQITVEDLDQTVYVQGDTSTSGTQVYDLQQILKSADPSVTGSHPVHLMLFASGGEGASATFTGVSVQYGAADPVSP